MSDSRAMQLLIADLTEKQKQQLVKGYIVVKAKRGWLRPRYRLRFRQVLNIQPLLFGFIPSIPYCVTNFDVPIADLVLAQKIALENSPRIVLRHAIEFEMIFLSVVGFILGGLGIGLTGIWWLLIPTFAFCALFVRSCAWA